MSEVLRQQLGFSSIVCLKAIITGMEDALGEKATAIALTAAGRNRGKNLVRNGGLTKVTSLYLKDIAYKLRLALGKDGTRLCLVDKIEQENDVSRFILQKRCVLQVNLKSHLVNAPLRWVLFGGRQKKFSRLRLQGKHIESVLRGSEYDVFQFTPFDSKG